LHRNYLMTLQAIGDGLAAISKPLDDDQSRVIAEVLAQRDAKETEVDKNIATLDAHRRQRLERRLQEDRRVASVPVDVERRQGDRRSGMDRRDVARAHIDHSEGDA
jgi:hypothetical protein